MGGYGSGKHKLELSPEYLNQEIRKLDRAFKKLEDLIYTWGQRDMTELDELRKRVKELESSLNKSCANLKEGK